jgi:hypothetical protein
MTAKSKAKKSASATASPPGPHAFKVAVKAPEEAFDRQRDQQEEAHPTDHRKGQKARPHKAPHPLAWLGLDAPNGVERVLQLAEDAAGAKQCDEDAEGGRQDAALGLGGVGGDVSVP